MPISLGRPEYHVVAQRGCELFSHLSFPDCNVGMNDPCAPGYDASTGLFHLMYQWNPYSHLWDNISWGAATSSDLVSWTYNSSEVSVSALQKAPEAISYQDSQSLLPNLA